MRKAFSISLVSFVCCLLAAEWYIARFEHLFPVDTSETSLRQYHLRNATLDSVDMLFLGDSGVKNSFIPQVFSEQAGASALNLGSFAPTAAVEDAFYLGESIRQHGPPRAAFVGRTFRALPLPPDGDLLLQEYARADMGWALFRAHLITPNEFLKILLADVFPSVRNRHRIRWWIEEQVLHQHKQILYPEGSEVADLRGYESETLFREAPLSAIEQAKAMAQEYASLGYDPVSSANEVLLRYMCSLADEFEFPLFVTLLPFAEDLLNDDLASILLSAQRDEILRITSAYSHCIVPDIPLAYPRSFLSDSMHTNHTGALLFTGRVTEIYKKSAR